jgi:hypothetical protein
MNASANESDDAMQKAFQEYMATGSKKAIAAATQQVSLFSAAQQEEQGRKKKQQKLQRRRSIYKSHESALQDFNSVLVRDWLHVDDQLGRVVDSIVNLRHRIRITNARLRKLQESSTTSVNVSSHKTISSCWKSYGYRGGGGGGGGGSLSSLKQQEQQEKQQQDQADDLELALSHSLLMHENMMVTLRKPLLPLLHEAQETLGRRLQDFMAVVDDACADLTNSAVVEDNDDKHGDEVDDDDALEWMSRMQADLLLCQELYRALAEEVYRKQELIQVYILDTVHDGLLGGLQNININESFSHVNDTTTTTTTTTTNPQASAEWCSSQWSRQGKSSALYKFQDGLDRIQQQQQQRQDDIEAKQASAASRT